VIQTRGSEALAQLLAHRLLLAEDEPGQDRAPFARETGCDRAGEPVVNPVSQPGDPFAAADHSPAPSAGDDVDAAAAKHRPLVESVAGATRLPQLDDALDDRALGRSSVQRKLKQNRFSQLEPAKAPNPRGHAQLERRAPGRAGDLDERRPDLADARREHASVERLEPDAAPPEPTCGEREPERRDAPSIVRDRHRGDRRG
jgi:hypothetical protein